MQNLNPGLTEWELTPPGLYQMLTAAAGEMINTGGRQWRWRQIGEDTITKNMALTVIEVRDRRYEAVANAAATTMFEDETAR